MPISMDPAAHYVTQSSCFGVGYTGPLTDRKITKYRKMGYFSNGLKPHSAAVKRAKRMSAEELYAIL